jgi:hypothetical protein
MPANPLFALRLAPEDRALLESLAAREKLPLGTVLRRALHWYANNVQPAQVKPLKPKATK